MNKTAVLELFAEFCGEEKHAKFLHALRWPARREGRLMYWQEQLVREFIDRTGQSIPVTYEELVRLYSSPDRCLSLGIPRAKPSALQFERPVLRHFHSVNQQASGGSHVTIFSVRISRQTNEHDAIIRDECSPDPHPLALESILDELKRGVESFLADKLEQHMAVYSVAVSLLEYSYHEVDLKPWKYRPGIYFLLDDLLCEQRCNRFLPEKTVGIPV